MAAQGLESQNATPRAGLLHCAGCLADLGVTIVVAQTPGAGALTPFAFRWSRKAGFKSRQRRSQIQQGSRPQPPIS